MVRCRATQPCPSLDKTQTQRTASSPRACSTPPAAHTAGGLPRTVWASVRHIRTGPTCSCTELVYWCLPSSGWVVSGYCGVAHGEDSYWGGRGAIIRGENFCVTDSVRTFCAQFVRCF